MNQLIHKDNTKEVRSSGRSNCRTSERRRPTSMGRPSGRSHTAQCGTPTSARWRMERCLTRAGRSRTLHVTTTATPRTFPDRIVNKFEFSFVEL